VPSINAILEAKIVAASIHGPAFAVHGAPAVPGVIDTASHGVFMKVLKGKYKFVNSRWRAKSLALSLARVHYHARSGKSKQIY
jgi:hypothetical protein